MLLGISSSLIYIVISKLRLAMQDGKIFLISEFLRGAVNMEIKWIPHSYVHLLLIPNEALLW